MTVTAATSITSTVRALIAEDEPILAAALTHALTKLWPELDIVATCANGVEALSQALALYPDVLFLDIKMPGKSGLEAAEELADSWPPGRPFPQLVFVTAYDEFAVAAFEHAAADYVLKPVNDARLGKTIERLKLRFHQRPSPQADSSPGEETGVPDHLARLLAQLQHALPALPTSAGAAGQPGGAMSSAAAPTPPATAAAPDKLTLIRAAVGNQVRMIPIADVVYFEALDKYVNVITRDGEALIRTSLKELLPQLDAGRFWQVHRGTIVNAGCVISATRDEVGKLSLQLRGRTEQLRVSPLYAHLFRQM